MIDREADGWLMQCKSPTSFCIQPVAYKSAAPSVLESPLSVDESDMLYVPLDDVAQLHDGVAWQSVASHELRVHQRTCCVAMVLLLNLLCLSVSHKLCTKYLLRGVRAEWSSIPEFNKD